MVRLDMGKNRQVILKVTSDQSKLQPWITGPMSHTIKELEIMKRKTNQDLARVMK